MTTNFRLSIELVPSTSWHNNLRSLMPKDKWDTLRKKVYADFGHRCGICKAKGELHCHEIWNYDDDLQIQSLSGLIALCRMCHAVKHFGLAELQSAKGDIEIDQIISHFMKMNNCTRMEFEEHKREAYKIWEERSKYEWQVKINDFLVE